MLLLAVLCCAAYCVLWRACRFCCGQVRDNLLIFIQCLLYEQINAKEFMNAGGIELITELMSLVHWDDSLKIAAAQLDNQNVMMLEDSQDVNVREPATYWFYQVPKGAAASTLPPGPPAAMLFCSPCRLPPAAILFLSPPPPLLISAGVGVCGLRLATRAVVLGWQATTMPGARWDRSECLPWRKPSGTARSMARR